MCTFGIVASTDGLTMARSREFPHQVYWLLSSCNNQRKFNIFYIYNIFCLLNKALVVNDKSGYLCDGALISDRFVLTTAECLRASPHFVILGDFDLSLDSPGAKENALQIEVEQRIPHPTFKLSELYHNIGLLQLNTIVPFSSYIRPACLADINISTNYSISTKIDCKTLMRVKFQVYDVENNACEAKMNYLSSKNRYNASAFLCGGRSNFRSCDRCTGEHTIGPLQIFHPKVSCMYQVIGFPIFYVNGCGSILNGSSTIAYNNVALHLKWIERVVWP